MKKILFFLIFFLSVGCAALNSVDTKTTIPPIPKFTAETAQHLGGAFIDCGEEIAVSLSYLDIMVVEDGGEKSFWRILIIDRQAVLFTRRLPSGDGKLLDAGVWLDLDGDYKPEAYFPNTTELKNTFNNVCGFFKSVLGVK